MQTQFQLSTAFAEHCLQKHTRENKQAPQLASEPDCAHHGRVRSCLQTPRCLSDCTYAQHSSWPATTQIVTRSGEHCVLTCILKSSQLCRRPQRARAHKHTQFQNIVWAFAQSNDVSQHTRHESTPGVSATFGWPPLSSRTRPSADTRHRWRRRERGTMALQCDSTPRICDVCMHKIHGPSYTHSHIHTSTHSHIHAHAHTHSPAHTHTHTHSDTQTETTSTYELVDEGAGRGTTHARQPCTAARNNDRVAERNATQSRHASNPTR